MQWCGGGGTEKGTDHYEPQTGSFTGLFMVSHYHELPFFLVHAHLNVRLLKIENIWLNLLDSDSQDKDEKENINIQYRICQKANLVGGKQIRAEPLAMVNCQFC